MKKFIGLIVLAMMVVLPNTVNASVALEDSCGEDVELAQPDGQYTHSKTCTITVNVSGSNSLNLYGITAKYDTSIIKVKNVDSVSPWALKNNVANADGAAITWTPSSAVSNTKSQVATIVFYIDKSDATKDCTIRLSQCFDENGKFICDTPANPTCKIENGKYYGKNGNEVTKEVYEAECINNPKTGDFLPYISLVAGIALAVGVFTVSRKNNKLYKI